MSATTANTDLETPRAPSRRPTPAARVASPAFPPPTAPPEPARSTSSATGVAPAVAISHELEITGAEADLLWSHYWANFEPLTELSVQRQHSDREEMLSLFANPRVLKIVGRDAGRPVGFAMITNSLEDVPELSPRFLRRRYPEQAARNAIYVGIYVVVDPAHRGMTLFHRLYLDCWQLVAEQAGVLVVDTCEFNRQAFDTDNLARTVAQAFPNSVVDEIDRQTWYGLELPLPMRSS